MAKRTRVSKTIIPSEVLSADDPIKNDLSIDINDVVAIASNKAEDKIRERIAAATAVLEAANDAYAKATKTLRSRLEILAYGRYSAGAAALAEALSNFSGDETTFTITPYSSFERENSDDEQDEKQDKDVRVVVTFNAKGSDFRALNFEKTLKANVVAAEVAELRATRAAVLEADKAVLEAKAALTRLPTLEKRWRGLMAEEKLRRTTVGSALVEKLLGSVDDNLLRLTGPKA